MRQLTLRLPDQSHRNLRLLAAAGEKTMTELVMEWIQRESNKLTTDHLLRVLRSQSDIPTRDYTQEEVAGFLKADAETPPELIEWSRKSSQKAKSGKN